MILTVNRSIVKILTLSRKSHHPFKTLTSLWICKSLRALNGKGLGNFELDMIISLDKSEFSL